MARKIRSAKGQMVDFDLLKIKEQIAAAPESTDVRARQNFIDKRLRRRMRKVKTPAPKIPAVDVDAKLPVAEEPAAELIEAKPTPETTETPAQTTTKQKARK